MDLTIAISTMGRRMGQIRLPPPQPEVHFLLLVQAYQGHQPAWASRGDVTLQMLHSIGLSHSRNAALDHAAGALLLFCDDDIALQMGGVLRLKEQLEKAPELAMACGWRAGRHRNRGAHAVNALNAGGICAPEFMIRLAPFQTAGLRFDPEFGVGATHGLGEDYIFICDALRKGLKGVRLPVVTGAHPGQSTGEVWHDPALLAARRAVLRRVFGGLSPGIALGYGLRHRCKFPDRAAFWQFMCGRMRG